MTRRRKRKRHSSPPQELDDDVEADKEHTRHEAQTPSAIGGTREGADAVIDSKESTTREDDQGKVRNTDHRESSSREGEEDQDSSRQSSADTPLYVLQSVTVRNRQKGVYADYQHCDYIPAKPCTPNPQKTVGQATVCSDDEPSTEIGRSHPFQAARQDTAEEFSSLHEDDGSSDLGLDPTPLHTPKDFEIDAFHDGNSDMTKTIPASRGEGVSLDNPRPLDELFQGMPSQKSGVSSRRPEPRSISVQGSSLSNLGSAEVPSLETPPHESRVSLTLPSPKLPVKSNTPFEVHGREAMDLEAADIMLQVSRSQSDEAVAFRLSSPLLRNASQCATEDKPNRTYPDLHRETLDQSHSQCAVSEHPDHTVSSLKQGKSESGVRQGVVVSVQLNPTDRGPGSQTANPLGALKSLSQGQWVSSTALELVLKACLCDGVRVLDSSYISTKEPALILRRPKLRLTGSETLVIIPLNHSNTHWTLIVIDLVSSHVEHYDSLKSDTYALEVKQVTKEFLLFLAQHDPRYDHNNWKFANSGCHVQKNSYDCGIYVLIAALSRLAKLPLPTAIDCNLWRRAFEALLLAGLDVNESNATASFCEGSLANNQQSPVANLDPESLTAQCHHLLGQESDRRQQFTKAMVEIMNQLQDDLQTTETAIVASSLTITTITTLLDQATTAHTRMSLDRDSTQKLLFDHGNQKDNYARIPGAYAYITSAFERACAELTSDLAGQNRRLTDIEKAMKSWDAALRVCENARDDQRKKLKRLKDEVESSRNDIVTFNEKQVTLLKELKALENKCFTFE
ncbi:MAG: hypothetical protein Q9164_007182 [Protoblastenia rupestris]